MCRINCWELSSQWSYNLFAWPHFVYVILYCIIYTMSYYFSYEFWIIKKMKPNLHKMSIIFNFFRDLLTICKDWHKFFWCSGKTIYYKHVPSSTRTTQKWVWWVKIVYFFHESQNMYPILFSTIAIVKYQMFVLEGQTNFSSMLIITAMGAGAGGGGLPPKHLKGPPKEAWKGQQGTSQQWHSYLGAG